MPDIYRGYNIVPIKQDDVECDKIDAISFVIVLNGAEQFRCSTMELAISWIETNIPAEA